jgi:hypothetical protein
MYRGRHRQPGSIRSLRILVSVSLLSALISVMLLSGVARGKGRPSECTGSPPTAVTIGQSLVSPEPTDAVRFSYLISSGGTVVATTTLTVGSGQTLTVTVRGLSKGFYTVTQEPDPASGVAGAPDQAFTIAPPACVSTVSYTAVVGAT